MTKQLLSQDPDILSEGLRLFSEMCTPALSNRIVQSFSLKLYLYAFVLESIAELKKTSMHASSLAQEKQQ